jgi:protein-L-isoaspartate(D-aspartate) O-methyltransferase
VQVNAADDPARESLFLTVTGTSAEAGDDGEAGRGNRVNGLITPGRPMTMESVAGKNPVTHVGKLYNLAAHLAAAAVVEELPEVLECECRLVSRIGSPIQEPQLAELGLRCAEPRAVEKLRPRAGEILRAQLAALPELWKELLAGRLALDRWPLRGPGPEPRAPALEERRSERDAMLREIERDALYTGSCSGRMRLDPQVLEALARVPRHAFVPAAYQEEAYANRPLPIGHGQTISQPFVVALMTDLAEITPDSVVLEVGAGCGYQTAVLAQLARRVYSVEVVSDLASRAREALGGLGIQNVELRCGDGWHGWPQHAPYDAIVVTAGATEVPPPLLEQLAPGGRLVIPVGPSSYGQDLLVVRKRQDGTLERRSVLGVAFVPLVHRA